MTVHLDQTLSSRFHPLRSPLSWVALAMLSACDSEVERTEPADLADSAIEEVALSGDALDETVFNDVIDEASPIPPTLVSDAALAEPAATVTMRVRSGENLVLIGEWADVSVEALADLNGIDVRDPLRLEQALLVPLNPDQADAFEAARQGFADRRLQRYLDGRGGLVGLADHVVRTGETAWGIAREEGVPVWVFAAYNRDAHLDTLSIGDTLIVPVMGDTIPVADEAPGEATSVQ